MYAHKELLPIAGAADGLCKDALEGCQAPQQARAHKVHHRCSKAVLLSNTLLEHHLTSFPVRIQAYVMEDADARQEAWWMWMKMTLSGAKILP